jgi:hypothetical protein
MQILAGYEIGTGRAVHIPVTHMASTGQTQFGKTTAQEALVERSGMRAVVFLTKRGESAFQFGRQIDPYFKERYDWRYVKALFEQTTGYSQNDKEVEIMELCNGVRSLGGVWERIKRRLNAEFNDKKDEWTFDPKGKVGKRELSILKRMHFYFASIIPELAEIPRSNRLELKKGVNIIDMRAYHHNVQEMLMANAFEWVYEEEQNTIFVVPEAWNFIGEDHGSITRTAGREFIRRAAALHNFLWADCQDIRGIDKVILGQMGCWMVGNQREMNEVARTIKSFVSLPAPPSATEIMTLGKGEFFMLYGTESRKIYVQPVWADANQCMFYAKDRTADGKPRRAIPSMPPAPKRPAAPPQPAPAIHVSHEEFEEKADAADSHIDHERENDSSDERTGEGKRASQAAGIRSVSGDSVKPIGITAPGTGRRTDAAGDSNSQSETAQIRAEIQTLHEDIQELARQLSKLYDRKDEEPMGKPIPHMTQQESKTAARQLPQSMARDASMEEIYAYVKRRAMEDPELLAVLLAKPAIRVTVSRPTIEADGQSLRGSLALLISEDFFKEVVSASRAYTELVRRGRKVAKPGVYNECDNLANLGFLTKENGGYQAVPGMKINIVEA